MRGIRFFRALAIALPIGLLLWALIGSAFAYTETFYLSASGDASAPETIAGAWDMSDVSTDATHWDTDDEDDGKLGPNDRLIVLDDDGDFTDALVIQQSGLSGKPITIIGESGETPTIDATGKNNAAYCNKDYITIDNIELTNANDNGIKFDTLTEYCEIKNSAIHGNLEYGIYDLGSYNIINSCQIYDNGDANTEAGIRESGSNGTIKNNVIYDNSVGAEIDGKGISLEACDSVSVYGNNIYNNGGTTDGCNLEGYTATNCTVYNNKCHDSYQNMEWKHGADDNLFYYNLFYAPESDSNVEIGEYDGVESTGNEFYNNTLYGSGDDSEFGIGISSSGNTIKNNIIWNTGASQYAIWLDSIEDGFGTFDNNDLDVNQWSLVAAENGADSYTLAQWKVAGGASNSISLDPVFLDAANDDFRLQSSSPCIDAGTDVGLTSDYLGNSIIGNPDMGAYEFQPLPIQFLNDDENNATVYYYYRGGK